MIQRLAIAFAQVKASSTSVNLLNKSDKSYIVCIEQQKLQKKYKHIMKSRKVQYYIYGQWIQKWVLCLWILKIVKHLILIDYYSISQIK